MDVELGHVLAGERALQRLVSSGGSFACLELDAGARCACPVLQLDLSARTPDRITCPIPPPCPSLPLPGSPERDVPHRFRVSFPWTRRAAQPRARFWPQSTGH